MCGRTTCVCKCMCLHMFTNIYIYIRWLIKKNLFPQTAILREEKMLLSRSPCLSFAGPTLGNNASYEDLFTTCQITPENRESLLDSLFKHAASITKSLLRADCCWLAFFFLQGLLTHPFQHVPWLSPAPSQNFRGTIAKISLSGHQQGAHWRKSEHQGPWWLALAKPNFWKLGCCIWSLFLETSKSIIRQWQRQDTAGAMMCFRTMVFGCHEASPLEVRLLPMKGKAIVQKHNHTGNWTRTKPKFSGALLLPDPGRQWVAALYKMIIINIQLSRNFREKMLLSRTRKEHLREGFQHNMHGFRN